MFSVGGGEPELARRVHPTDDCVMPDQKLVDDLAQKGLELSSKAGGELERSCWMVVHEHAHGVRPSEYDIRDIPEDLYLAVLNQARHI